MCFLYSPWVSFSTGVVVGFRDCSVFTPFYIKKEVRLMMFCLFYSLFCTALLEASPNYFFWSAVPVKFCPQIHTYSFSWESVKIIYVYQILRILRCVFLKLFHCYVFFIVFNHDGTWCPWIDILGCAALTLWVTVLLVQHISSWEQIFLLHKK